MPFSDEILTNAFLVAPAGDRLYSRDEIVDVATHTLFPSLLPRSIVTGSRYAGAPVPGGPALSADGLTILSHDCCTLRVIATDTLSEESVNLTPRPPWDSGVMFSPDQSEIVHIGYSGSSVRHFDRSSFEVRGAVSVSDFTGELAFTSDGRFGVVGGSGNPRNRGGRIVVYEVDSLERVDSHSIDLADNLVLTERDEVLVSSGPRAGIDQFEIRDDGSLDWVKSFTLGINRFRISSGIPRDDEIRRLVFKARSSVDLIFESGFESGTTVDWSFSSRSFASPENAW